MLFDSIRPRTGVLLVLSAGLLATSCTHKYETPIVKNTQQPDKVLFDQAMKDIEHGRYETARISLNTLMNTYESSEYMAKAKLAVADSWYREGGANGMAQAEAEYKDFILFYPSMEEAAEAQNRVCEIHYRQMDKSDRDWTQTLRAETECRAVLQQFPNSKFAPQAAQRLRDIQESLAEHEFAVGDFYWRHDMNPAAANRLNAVVDQYPLYSKSGDALYEAGDAYSKMGPRFRKSAADMFSRIVQDYPLSDRAQAAKKRLEEMEAPVPKVDQAALDREKYNEENYHRPSMLSRSMGWMHGGPDVSHASKVGPPTMTDPKRTIPASIPVVNNTGSTTGAPGTGTTELTATPVGANSALDKNPDARTAGPAAKGQTAAPAAGPLPTNRDADLKKYREKMAKKQEKLEKKKKKKVEPSDSGKGCPSTRRSGRGRRCPGFHQPVSAMSRILLADDSPQALRLAEQILSTQGIEVVSVTDGATALRRLPDVDPDLLITDVYLPTRSAFEIARFLRSQDQYRHLPIIFAAAPNDEFNEQDATNSGAGAILRKPFEASALLGAVHKLLADRPAKAETPLPDSLDRHSIRAAVTLALDTAMPKLIDELTERVLLALSHR